MQRMLGMHARLSAKCHFDAPGRIGVSLSPGGYRPLHRMRAVRTGMSLPDGHPQQGCRNTPGGVCRSAQTKRGDGNQPERGRFIALSDWILAQGGTVYGAGYADHFRVVHKRAATPKERDEFKGSKYVQSDPGNVFAQVRADLEQGRHVLFSGTPCQTAGLRSVLDLQHAPTEKLWLVDLVCHGVPAPTYGATTWPTSNTGRENRLWQSISGTNHASAGRHTKSRSSFRKEKQSEGHIRICSTRPSCSGSPAGSVRSPVSNARPT